MSVLIMEEISRAGRKLLQFHNVFLIEHRQTHAKRLEREKKVLFGKLVETLPQRRKRLKSKKDTVVVEEKRTYSYKRMEEEFLLKNAKRMNLQVLSNSSNPMPLPDYYGYKSLKNVATIPLNRGKTNNLSNPNYSTNSQELTTPLEINNPSKGENHDKEKTIAEEKNDNTEAIVFPSNLTAPSEIIVKNMLSFSIYDSTKSARIAHKKMPVIKDIISLSAKKDNYNQNLPSVTRILSATMSEAAKRALAIWKEKMIQELGVNGFNIYQKNLFKDGHDLHSSIENSLLQKQYEVPEKVKPAFESVQNVLKDINSVSALESHVVHPKLFYRGITDCVATYRGELCVIDWKKSDKRKDTIDSIYDAPTQVASYIGALNADLNYPFEIKKGLVVVAYTSGEEATVYEIVQEDLFIYWKAWLRRLQKYFVDSKKLHKERGM